jgi:hypothetical protein
MITTDEFVNYVLEIKAASDADWNRKGYTKLPAPEFHYTTGKKYYKVMIKTCGSTSVHCFVDAEGNIYKPASFNAPAKDIRGNIKDSKKPLLCGDFYRYR